jgi:hypothetical protein
MLTEGKTVNEAVKERIEGALLEMIPDEEWNKIIHNVLEYFLLGLRDGPKKDDIPYWDRERVESRGKLHKMVEDAIQVKFKERLAYYLEHEVFSDLDFELRWGNLIRDIATEAARGFGTHFITTILNAIGFYAGGTERLQDFINKLAGGELRQCPSCGRIGERGLSCQNCGTSIPWD